MDARDIAADKIHTMEEQRWAMTDHWNDVQVRFAGKGWPREREGAGRALLPDGVQIAWLNQIHSADVHVVQGPGCGGEGDALVTDQKGLAPAVVTADCVPVLLAGRKHIAAVHAGWRGVVAEVVARAVEAAAAKFDDRPEIAWIGPAISGEVYEVSDEVAQQVAAVSSPEIILPGRGERPHVDLKRAAQIQLERLGVQQIRQIGGCTLSQPETLWSYRRDGAGAGRNYALIWR